MIQDLFIPEEWERLNDQFRTHLKVPNDQLVKFYRGLGHAIYEMSMGTSQFYSHKRSVGFVKGNSPYFEFLIPNYLREAYQIQSMDLNSLQQHHASWTEWANTLKKDTVFVIASEDHPVTGELQDLEELDVILNEKKIFFLRISHSSHLFQPIELKPYTVRICSLSRELSFVLMGAKFKVPPVMAQVMNWSTKETQSSLRNLQNKKEFPKEIQKFEGEMTEFSYPWSNAKRIYDRSLLVFPGVTGDLMTHALSKALGFSASTSLSLNLWSTHLCQWNSVKMFKNWWKLSPPDDVLRDLLIMSPDVIQRNGFAEVARKTYEELKSSQTWKF